jgi:hypothetical protein
MDKYTGMVVSHGHHSQIQPISLQRCHRCHHLHSQGKSNHFASKYIQLIRRPERVPTKQSQCLSQVMHRTILRPNRKIISQRPTLLREGLQEAETQGSQSFDLEATYDIEGFDTYVQYVHSGEEALPHGARNCQL